MASSTCREKSITAPHLPSAFSRQKVVVFRTYPHRCVSLCTYASFQRGRGAPPRDLTPEAMPNLSVTNGACSASLAFKINSSITPNFHFLSTPRLRISIYAAVKAHYPVTIVYCNDIISPENTDCFLNTGYIPGHFQ